MVVSGQSYTIPLSVLFLATTILGQKYCFLSNQCMYSCNWLLKSSKVLDHKQSCLLFVPFLLHYTTRVSLDSNNALTLGKNHRTNKAVICGQSSMNPLLTESISHWRIHPHTKTIALSSYFPLKNRNMVCGTSNMIYCSVSICGIVPIHQMHENICYNKSTGLSDATRLSFLLIDLHGYPLEFISLENVPKTVV